MWTRQTRSVSPSVDADVLQLLVRTRGRLTGLQVATLANRSYAQLRSVLHRLVADGLVDVEDHGSAYAYRCNRDHLLSTPSKRSPAQPIERNNDS